MPKISIIIPNYNTEKYLPRCLDSLVAQTLQDIEIIIIDDGSTDDSVKIMNQYAQKDKRIKIITQKNSGPATARNKGLDVATGKYLMFCDSDDWYEKNMCQIMFNTIEKKHVDIVCCHNTWEFENELDDIENERMVEHWYNPNVYGKYKLTPKNILIINVLLWNKIWRRDLVQKYNIRFPDGHEFDDDAFVRMYACVATDIFFIKKPLYHYFLRKGSIMSTQYNKQPKNRYDGMFSINYVIQFLIKNDLIREYSQLVCNMFLNHIKYLQEHPFFTNEELCGLCWDMTKKIQTILGIDAFLTLYGTKDAMLVTKKSYPRLIFERILYRTAMVLSCRRNTKKYYRLWRMYTINKLEFRYKKGLIGMGN